MTAMDFSKAPNPKIAEALWQDGDFISDAGAYWSIADEQTHNHGWIGGSFIMGIPSVPTGFYALVVRGNVVTYRSFTSKFDFDAMGELLFEMFVENIQGEVVDDFHEDHKDNPHGWSVEPADASELDAQSAEPA